VVDRARQAKRIDNVIVATDDQRIVDALRPFGTACVLTSPAHQSGTDRIAEAALALDADIVVNVQGDEPEIEPATIDALVQRLENSDDDMATAATRFPASADVHDPNLVKVVIAQLNADALNGDRDIADPAPLSPATGDPDSRRCRDPRFAHDPPPFPGGRAIYFSRSPIPMRRDPANPENSAYYLHQGIYAYRRRFLLEFASWSTTPLERTEKLEQLRVLEHGRSIYVLITSRPVHGIDTAEQYAELVKRVRAGAV
jgi:3-deoxy-manno-octulosonate cytidylyltransferase (CMP-KDO synthetase)